MPVHFDNDAIVVSGNGGGGGAAGRARRRNREDLGGNLDIGRRAQRRLGRLAAQGRVGTGRAEARRIGQRPVRVGTRAQQAVRRGPGRPRRG